MEKTITYSAKGLVYGLDWFQNSCAYTSIEIKANTKEELDRIIDNKLEDGSLDSGMGFYDLKGALMNIKIISEIEVENKIYTNIESELEFYGELSDKEMDFLKENII